MRMRNSVCWSSPKRRRVASSRLIHVSRREARSVDWKQWEEQENSNRYEIFWYWKWMKELSKDDLSHTKTFSIAEKSTIFADTQFACTQPSKNITTLFDWSVRMENSYEIKHKKIRSSSTTLPSSSPTHKMTKFLTLHEHLCLYELRDAIIL